MGFLTRGTRVGTELDMLRAESLMRKEWNLHEGFRCVAVYVGPRVVKVCLELDDGGRIQSDFTRKHFEEAAP